MRGKEREKETDREREREVNLQRRASPPGGYEVMLMKRRRGARFMPSVHVFPGV